MCIKRGPRARLVKPARVNAADARQAGALTAEVVGDPRDAAVLLVISRSPSMQVLRDFLDWHE